MKWVREPDVDSRRRGEWATHGFLVRGEELGASSSGRFATGREGLEALPFPKFVP